MEDMQRVYLQAFGHQWLLTLYDPVAKWLGLEAAHRQLLDQADIQPGHRVLEIGCGTGIWLFLPNVSIRKPTSSALIPIQRRSPAPGRSRAKGSGDAARSWFL